MYLEREHPGKVGKCIATVIQHIAAKYFIRRLDRNILDLLSGKHTENLDTAINLAIIANIEARNWEETHNPAGTEPSACSRHSYRDSHKIIYRKQVTYVMSNDEA